MIYTTGQKVRITYCGDSIEGTVLLGSPNMRSLMLAFPGILGRHIGSMPVMRGDDDTYRSLMDHPLDGPPVLIEPIEPIEPVDATQRPGVSAS